MRDLHDALQQEFGFATFRPGQEELIQAVMAGHDAFGVLPTGSGKTLCYQMPGRLLGGVTLVVEPLLALMADQVGRLQASGEKRAIALSSRLAPPEFRVVLQQLDHYRFVFLGPETLRRPDVLRRLQQLTVTTFVVDEAHCISQWGPDFRPAYLQLGAAIAQLRPRSILALTATAPEKVQADITRGLRLRKPVAVITSIDRPNVFLGLETVADRPAKNARLLAVCQAVAGPQIIYFDRKRQAEETAAWLGQKTGRPAAFYHAGLAAHDRELIQRQFMAGQLQLICATSAFGMGIDKPDVRLVVYMHVPESLEAYSQGIGRAGRDGEFSLSLLLIAPGDLQRAAQFAASLPDERTIKTIYAAPDAFSDLADPQVQLIEAYIQAGFTQQQVQKQLAARMGEKQASFQAMQRYLQTAGCLRGQLLTHFDSTGRAHDDRCCGPLTADILATVAPAKPTMAMDTTVDSNDQPQWQAVFKRLFK